MLINTVILFLRDALPIFIIAVLLLGLSSKYNSDNKWLFGGITLGTIASLLLTNSIGFVAHSFDSTGLERFFSMLYVLIYLMILWHVWLVLMAKKPSHCLITALVIIALVLALNGANFLVYITGYWSQSGAVQPLLLGVVLGSGICISIGVLLYFLLAFSEQNLSPYTSVMLIVLYAGGQLMQASKLLLQIDVFPEGELLWDTNQMIKESSELGHFLTALFGYDATPTLSQLLMYLVAVIVPLAVLFQLKKRLLANHLKQEVC